MTKWYVNDYEITPAFVTARTIDTPWAQTTHNFYNQHGIVVNPNRKAQPTVMDISIRGSNRFSIESSIRAELTTSPTVYVESSNKYIHKDQRSIWFVPSGMNVTDSGAKFPLKCTITGLIDERTLHSCEFLTHWSGTSLTLATDTRYGTYSVKESISTDGTHNTICTLTQPKDVSRADLLCLWIKSDHASSWFDVIQVGLSDGTTTALANVTGLEANTWDYQEFKMTLFSAIDESAITKFVLNTNPPSATSYWVEIAWVWVE